MEMRYIPGGPRQKRKRKGRCGVVAAVLVLCCVILCGEKVQMAAAQETERQQLMASPITPEMIGACMARHEGADERVFESERELEAWLGFGVEMPLAGMAFRRGSAALYENGMEVTLFCVDGEGKSVVYEMSLCTGLQAAQAVEGMYGGSGEGAAVQRRGENTLVLWRRGTVCHRLIGSLEGEAAANLAERLNAM